MPLAGTALGFDLVLREDVFKLAPFRFRLAAKTALCSLVLPLKLEAPGFKFVLGELISSSHRFIWEPLRSAWDIGRRPMFSFHKIF